MSLAFVWTMVPLNAPNVLTVIRILLVPVLVVALLEKTGGGDLLAAIVFAVASLTDAIDGYLALDARTGKMVCATLPFLD